MTTEQRDMYAAPIAALEYLERHGIGGEEADLVLALGHRFGQRRFKFADVEEIVGDDDHACWLIESLSAANMLIVAIGEEDTTISLNRFLAWRFRR